MVMKSKSLPETVSLLLEWRAAAGGTLDENMASALVPAQVTEETTFSPRGQKIAFRGQ